MYYYQKAGLWETVDASGDLYYNAICAWFDEIGDIVPGERSRWKEFERYPHVLESMQPRVKIHADYIEAEETGDGAWDHTVEERLDRRHARGVSGLFSLSSTKVTESANFGGLATACKSFW